MSDLDTPLTDLSKTGRAAARRRESSERREKLAMVDRLVREGKLTIRRAAPGELPPPGSRDTKAGRALLDRGRDGQVP